MDEVLRPGWVTRTGQTVGLQVLKPQPGGHLPVRVTTAFNRLLALPGTTVREVSFEPAQITVTVALRRRRLACADCQYSTRARYDPARSTRAGGTWTLAAGGCSSGPGCAGLSAPPMACAPRACRSLGSSRASPATSRTWSHGWRPAWTRPRSAG